MGKLNVKAYSDGEYAKIREKNLTKAVFHRPVFKIFQAGDNSASTKYVSNKLKKAKEVGVVATVHHVISSDKEEIQKSLDNFLSQLSEGDKYMVQLPLPDGVVMQKNCCFSRRADVDGLSLENKRTLLSSDFREFDFQVCCIPATARGIAEYMVYLESRKGNSSKFYDREKLEGKTALIINRSDLVGRPLARLLEYMNMTVTLAHSHTPREYLLKTMENVDYVICGVGIPKFFTEEDIPEGVTFIDVSTNFVDGKMCGDLYLENGDTDKFDFTPVPFGVGQLTVMSLMKNVSDVAFLKEL